MGLKGKYLTMIARAEDRHGCSKRGLEAMEDPYETEVAAK